MAFFVVSAVRTTPNYGHISCFGVFLMDLWASYGWLFTTLEGGAILLGSCIFIFLVKVLATRFIEDKPEENPTNFLDLKFLSDVPEAKGTERPTDLIDSPPFPREIEAIPSIEIIRRYKAPIDRLVRESALSEEEVNAYLLPAVEKLAGIVHLLPASQEDHHSYEGGLFTHSLETATNAVVAAQNQIFDADETPGQKYQNKKRWVLAAALAGLAHDLGKVIQDIRVVDADTHKIRRMDVPMKNWIDADHVRAYSISWANEDRTPKSHQGDSHFMLRSILSDYIVHFLCFEGNAKIYKALRNAVYDMSSGPLGKILQDADIRSASDDQVHRAQLSANNQIIQTSNAGQICRAIQRLLTSGKWSYNKADSKVFVTREGCFLRWDDESTAAEISAASRQLASETKTSYVPRSKEIMYENLQHGRVLLQKEKVGGYMWSVCPIATKNKYITCLRFHNAQHLFGFDMVPTIIDAHVLGTQAIARQKTAWLKEYGEVPETFNQSTEETINGEKPEVLIERAIGVMKVDDKNKTFEEVLGVLRNHSTKTTKKDSPDFDGGKQNAQSPTQALKTPSTAPQNVQVPSKDLDGEVKWDQATTPRANADGEILHGDTLTVPMEKADIPDQTSQEIQETEEDKNVDDIDNVDEGVTLDEVTDEEVNDEPDPLGGEESAYAEYAEEEGEGEGEEVVATAEEEINGRRDAASLLEAPNDDAIARARSRIMGSFGGEDSAPKETTANVSRQTMRAEERERVAPTNQAKAPTMNDYKRFIADLEANVKNMGGKFFKHSEIRDHKGTKEVSLAGFYKEAERRGMNRDVLEQTLKQSRLRINFGKGVVKI